MNVVFGRLSATDVRIFLNGRGTSGLHIAALEVIATHGFINFPQVAEMININPSTLRPRVANLFAAGMLATVVGGSFFWITQRGRVFLRICALISDGRDSSELRYILSRLDIAAAGQLRSDLLPSAAESSLIDEVHTSATQLGTVVSGGPYLPDPPHFGFGNSSWVER